MDSSISPQDIAQTTGTPSTIINFGSSILDYVQVEIIPVIFAAVSLLTIIVGLPMNILFTVAMHRRGRLKVTAYEILFHVAIMDIAAIILIIFPGFITSIAKKWLLGTVVCIIEGVLVNSLFVMTFSYCIWSMVERWMYLSCRDYHEKLFKKCHGNLFLLVIAIQWFLTVAYCILPISGVSAIEYQGAYGLQCDRTYSDNAILTHVHFAITYIISFVAFAFISCGIMCKRINQKEQTVHDIENGSITSDASQTNMLEARSSTPDQDIGNHPSTSQQNGAVCNANKSKHTQSRNQRKTIIVQRRKSNWDIYRDIEDFQLASTLTLSWLFTYGIWAMYVVCAYVMLYENKNFPIWNGIYPIAVMMANISYAMRPVVYLVHNKSLRSDIRGIIPGCARNKYVEYNAKAKDKINSIETKVKDKIHLIEDKINRKTHQKIDSNTNETSLPNIPNKRKASLKQTKDVHEMKRIESESDLDEHFSFEHGHDPMPKTSNTSPV